MSLTLPWIIAAVFFVAFIGILIKVFTNKRPDIDVSIGEKIGIVPGGGGGRLQMKCSFLPRKGTAVVNKIRLVLNRDTHLSASQFIEDFGSAYVGSKARVAPIKVEGEIHEGIEFSPQQENANWKPGTNLLLMKVWIDPNVTEHSPSKMYRIDFHLDDGVIAALTKGGSPQVGYANVVRLEQVYPPVSFKLAPRVT